MRQNLLAVAAAATLALALSAFDAHAAALIEPLRAERGVLCTGDRVWCVARAGDGMTIRHNENRAYRNVVTIPLPASEQSASEPWPSIIRIALPGRSEVALVGAVQSERGMYSGGGATVRRLTLFEVRPDAAPMTAPVLEAPIWGRVSIRACFTREDERARRGACHDEYSFSATLHSLPSADAVAFLYRSRADTFPGRRRRDKDSLAGPPLRQSDLRRAHARPVERSLRVERAAAYVRRLSGTLTG